MALISPPEEYTLEKCLWASTHSEVYAAVRISDGREVVLKAYIDDRPDASGSSRARREFEALCAAAGPHLPGAIELLPGLPSVLVLERVRGIPLRGWVRPEAPPDVASFLEVAIQATAALSRVHAARLIHRDLSPNNIVVDPATLETHLLDLGLVRPLGAVHRSAEAPSVGFAGTLQYVAPEQTGRMDRGIDCRSDLYGLGATFYFCLTGHPPFDCEDPITLIHAHMARVPRPPHEQRPDLPVALSRMLLKLLQKEPEDRYQTAQALHRDLLTCRAQLQDTGRIADDLPLGRADAPLRPVFAKKLYGRDAQVEALRAAYTRAARGSTELVLLCGAPGTGKSTLVSELRTLLAETGGYLAAGKFDPYRHEVPYTGFLAAFESLVHQLLIESDVRLARWKETLCGALGNVAGVLVGLVPDLGAVLGEVPPVPQLGPRETQARLALAVQRFAQGCGSREHPLVLFLDDMQWADAGSRYLLEELLKTGERTALLIVAAHREAEAGDSPELLEQLGRDHARTTRIDLLPLDPDATARMLGDALGRSIDETRSLAQCVALKTGGSPLLIQQFVLHMHALGWIRSEAGRWAWDEAAIAASDIPDGAAGLMVAKLERLNEQARRVIELASCVGDQFDVGILTAVSEHARDDIEPSLFALVEEGLIAPSPLGFRFVHDRIREAAQALLSAEELARLHYRTGRLLLERTPEASLPERAFEIADHLNRSIGQIREEERSRAISINVVAGKRALAAGAAQAATSYLEFGHRLFEEGDWERDPALAFSLFSESAETAYQMREFERSLHLLDALESQPLDPMQQLQTVIQRIRVLTLTRAEAALEVALGAMRPFGIRWSRRPSRLRVRLALSYTDWLLRGPLDERLFERSRSRDPTSLSRLLLISAGGAAMLQSSLNLLCLATAYALRIYLRNGVLRGPAYALGSYAAFRIGVRGDLAGAERLARASMDWMARMPNPLVDVRCRFNLQAFVFSWLQPRRMLLEPLWQTAQDARELGDIEFSSYAVHQHVSYFALSGAPLDEVRAKLEELVQRDGSNDVWRFLPTYLRAYALLCREERAAIDWNGELAAADALEGPSLIARVYPRVHWIGVLCLLGEHALAAARADALAQIAFDVGAPGAYLTDYTMFRGIAHSSLAEGSDRLSRRRHVRIVRACLRQLRIWARHGEDFLHMAQLLDAECARLRRYAVRASSLYKLAAQRARERGYYHHAALAHERRGELLSLTRRETEAAAAYRQARAGYQEWGALCKVRQLEDRERGMTASLGRSAARPTAR